MTNHIKVNLKAHQSFIPFHPTNTSTEHSVFSGVFGVTETVNHIKDRLVVGYDFSGQLNPGSTGYALGYRAMSHGGGDDSGWRWLSWITGFSGGFTAGNIWDYRLYAAERGITPGSANWDQTAAFGYIKQTSIAEWYKWGARRFHIHAPFGRVRQGYQGAFPEEAKQYQPDAFVCARDGLVDYSLIGAGKTFCNNPMPWITNDVVDGLTQGFVPLWKALTTGTQGDLSNDMWQRLTGIGGPSAWFDPNDPITVSSYIGAIHNENLRRFKLLFDRGNAIGTTSNGAGIETNGVGCATFARQRLEDSVSPFLRSGMKIGFDALALSPGPVVGLNAAGNHFPDSDYNSQPYEVQGITYGATLDAAWWSFFNDYVVPSFGRNNIYVEATPYKFTKDEVQYNNPYLGFPVITVDEFGRAGFPGAHHPSEMGEVEILRNTFCAGAPHIGQIEANNATTAILDGEYWFLGASMGIETGSATVTEGSNLPALISGNHRYLRAKRLPVANTPGSELSGYSGVELWGPYLLAKHLIRKQVNQNEPNAIGDKTTTRVMMAADMIRPLPSGVTATSPSGVTLDFSRLFPNITSYANYLAPLRSGAVAIDPRRTYSGLTANITDIAPIAVEYSSGVASTDFTDKIHGVMWLTVADYDAFASTTKLGGVSGGAIYTPVTSTSIPTTPSHSDLDKVKFDNWMDIKLQSWMDRFGTTPKYIAWKLSEYDVARETGPSYNRQPTSFEMERYLFLPKTIPTTATEDKESYKDRIEYFASVPGITWGPGDQSEEFVNNGYDIARLDPRGRTEIEADLKYTAAQNAAKNMITLAKNWRTSRNLNAKVGVYNLPYLPKSAYNVYAIDTSSGPNASSRAVVSNTGNWNDRVFAKQSQRHPFGIRGWYTEAETEIIKNAVKLEYRKRLESVSAVCEVLFASMQNSSSEETIAIDPTIESNKKWHMEVLELGNNLKTKPQWDTITGEGTATNPTCELQTLVNVTVVNPELSDFPSIFTPADGDPFTKSQGTLFNHEQVEYNLIDWVRDDYLRPSFVIFAPRVQGMSIQSDDMYRATNAMKTGNYTGKTADRDWVLKWIVAEDGAGATINWSNAASVDTNIRRFFAVRNSLVKRYLDRFNKGVPRKNIHDPYGFSPFAACWNRGSSGPTFGYYPSSVNGQAITDVVPMVWASTQLDNDGVSFTGGFRSPGNTGNMPSVQFARFSQMANRIPSTKRVMLPWYWLQESPSSQLIGSDYYKAGSDGCTYFGGKHRAHETPGTVKFMSPWADKNTLDAKNSFTAFLAQCVAAGVSFDKVASDFEGYGAMSLGSHQNTFDNPFGPTGMPAGLTSTAVMPWNNYELVPDPRATQSIVTDPRFSSQVLPLTGLTFGASVQKYYYDMQTFANLGRMRLASGLADNGLTASQILAHYILEGSTGISAATGPANCVSYWVSGPVIPANLYTATPVTGNPWKAPWSGSEPYYLGPYKVASKKRAWFAWDKTLRDIVINNHMKTIWIDSLQGSTAQQQRNIAFNFYNHVPISIDEGSLIMDDNTHPVVYYSSLPLSATGANIGASPYLYGERNDSLGQARYYPNPTTDSQRYTFVVNDTAGTAFGSTAKAYISFINDMTKVRAFLRTSPNSWKDFAPWLKSPEDYWFRCGYYVGDDSPIARSYEAEYLRELAFHNLLSGAQYINYFNPGRGPNSALSTSNSTGFTAGITFMQGVFDTWKVQAESCRVQPASNETGDVDALVERILLSDAGGNHAGCTGTVTSGGKLLKYVNGKTGSVAFGGENNDTYLWRITVPPQAVGGGIYSRVDYPSAAAVADMPATVTIPANETGFWIKRTANSYKPVYRAQYFPPPTGSV